MSKRNKEMMVRICLVISLCAVLTGFTSKMHKENYNEDKFRCEKRVLTTKIDKKDDASMFMKAVHQIEVKRVNDEKIKLVKIKAEISKEKKIKAEKAIAVEQNNMKLKIIAEKKEETKEANIRVRKERSKLRKSQSVKTYTYKKTVQKPTLSRGGDVSSSKNSSNSSGNYNTTFNITFYTSQNGSTMSSGKQLFAGACASNSLPQGTTINLEGYGQVTVEDCGGGDLNSSNRLDIYLPKNNGESDSEYSSRALSMGRRMVKGYIIK